jgi:hypothetical protein
MDDFTDQDINLFIIWYQDNLLETSMMNSKMALWVEYLKTKKYYRMNGIEEDRFFKKRFNISQDDIKNIHKTIYKIKTGYNFNKHKTTVVGNTDNFMNNDFQNSFSQFNEDENYENTSKKFELLDEVQDAMNSYYNKMKKLKNKKLNWKKDSYEDNLQNRHIPDSVANIQDRYYTDGLNSELGNIDYDVHQFGKNRLNTMNKSDIISQLDDYNNILEHNNLMSNDFDTEYKRSIANINSNKKTSIINNIDDSNINNIDKLNMNNPSNINEQRFWQDQDMMQARTDTRNSSIKNPQPFENQFQYLDGNYNRVIDPRLLSQSARLDNRSFVNR